MSRAFAGRAHEDEWGVDRGGTILLSMSPTYRYTAP
jgi:hypothetical protein